MKQKSTESRNTASMHLDEMTIVEALQTMNEEDKKVPTRNKQSNTPTC
ncbi:N-acetylmuramic acid-6-phosphate etherase [Staphylococcus gallinarum]|uniref:N-acetylmuramic acid-6-phosphate etherase n=1 Tax=Staphylococcus gallinarum TaxID=1293 RepID=A0A380FN07_STAGA|nr:N-acetylmuramic acid-6-phosphate etherase [Staphylococcus gallinarum]